MLEPLLLSAVALLKQWGNQTMDRPKGPGGQVSRIHNCKQRLVSDGQRVSALSRSIVPAEGPRSTRTVAVHRLSPCWRFPVLLVCLVLYFCMRASSFLGLGGMAASGECRACLLGFRVMRRLQGLLSSDLIPFSTVMVPLEPR